MRAIMSVLRFQQVPRFIAILGVMALFVTPNQAWAQNKGGGGITVYGNVVAWYDAEANTLYAIGDTGNNKCYISLSDESVTVSSGPSSGTSINGVVGGYFSATIGSIGFSVVIEGRQGNDTIVVNAGTELSMPQVVIEGGDGDDILNVHVSVPENVAGAVVGNLEIRAGKGNDKVNLAMLFYDKVLHVAGNLQIDGGDGGDEVTIYDRVLVVGSSVLNGGVGRNGLTLSAVLFADSLVSNFRSVTFW